MENYFFEEQENIFGHVIYLVEFGSARVGAHVHDVDPVGAEAGHDEARPGARGVVVAAAARVPAGVVDLVADVGEVEARDDLGVVPEKVPSEGS